MTKQEYQNISDLIKDGDIESVFDCLIKICHETDSKYKTDIETLNSQYMRVLRSGLLGTLHDNHELNRITGSIISYKEKIYNEKSKKEKVSLKEYVDRLQKYVIVFPFLLVIAMAIVSYIATRSNKPKNDFQVLISSLDRINELKTDNTYNKLSNLSDSKDLICDKLKCTYKESHKFIQEYRKYLNDFLFNFEEYTHELQKTKVFKSDICDTYFDDGSIIQIIDSLLVVKTYHMEDFCDSLRINEFNQNIRLHEVNYEIESISVKNLKNEKENTRYRIQEIDTKRIRFVMKSLSQAKRCDLNNKCLDLELSTTILVRAVGSHKIGFDFIVEGFLINHFNFIKN